VGGKSGVEACVALHQIEFSWSASKTHRLHVSPTINADYLKNKKRIGIAGNDTIRNPQDPKSPLILRNPTARNGSSVSPTTGVCALLAVLAVNGQQGQARTSDAVKRGMWSKVRRSLACADVVARWAALGCDRRVVRGRWVYNVRTGMECDVWLRGTVRISRVAEMICNGKWTMDNGR
jgi:hypothetical protein